MNVPMLDLRPQYATVRDEVDRAIAEVVASQRFVLGPVVEKLEAELASRIGVEHALGCASGTDAILLAIRALQLPPGAEVIVPAFTFFATAGAVWNAGAKPVFVDIDPDTFNVTAANVRAAIGPRTEAIVAVHLFGQMAPMAELQELAGRHGLALIEDAAQAIDATQEIGGERVRAGGAGTMGCFSFFPTKNLGAYGDAGLVTTRDAALAERVGKLRVHGGKQMYHHEMVGTNSRLDALQAAVLLAKLPHLDAWTASRQRHARYYSSRLDRNAGVRVPGVAPGNTHVFNQYTIRSGRRDALQAHLQSRGVGTAVYYPVPLHLQECFSELGHRPGDLANAERAASEVLSLPVYPELSAEALEHVASAIEAFD